MKIYKSIKSSRDFFYIVKLYIR